MGTTSGNRTRRYPSYTLTHTAILVASLSGSSECALVPVARTYPWVPGLTGSPYVQCSAAQRSAAQCSAAQRSAVQCSAATIRWAIPPAVRLCFRVAALVHPTVAEFRAVALHTAGALVKTLHSTVRL